MTPCTHTKQRRGKVIHFRGELLTGQLLHHAHTKQRRGKVIHFRGKLLTGQLLHPRDSKLTWARHRRRPGSRGAIPYPRDCVSDIKVPLSLPPKVMRFFRQTQRAMPLTRASGKGHAEEPAAEVAAPALDLEQSRPCCTTRSGPFSSSAAGCANARLCPRRSTATS